MKEASTNYSTFNLTIAENHKLLYFNLPKELIQKLDLTPNDLLEYDIYNNHFFARKKGTGATMLNEIPVTLFSGLLVERTITRNNTVLRTNLPKEVAQPLAIEKSDQLEIRIEGEIIVGRKINPE